MNAMRITLVKGDGLFRVYSRKKYKTLKGARSELTKLLNYWKEDYKYHAKKYHEAYISVNGVIYTVLRSNGYDKYIITTP